MEKWVIRPIDWQAMFDRGRYLLLQKKIRCNFMRPLPLLAAAAAAGVLAADACPEILLLTGCGTVIFLTGRRFTLNPSWLPLLLPVVFTVSAMQTVMIIKPARTQADQLAGRVFDLHGTVISIPGPADTGGSIAVRQSNGIALMLYYAAGRADIRYGDQISATVRLRKPDRQMNPGGFDEARWLSSQGIYLAARPLDDEDLLIASRADRINLMQLGADCRGELGRIMNRILENEQSALLSGLLVGDTSRISDAMSSDFRRAGLAHLLSVSGANVSYLLLPAGRILRSTKIGRQIRLFILLGLLIGFGFLTGWQISVSRAILMSGVVLAGRLLHRPADAVSSLSAAALFLLISKPLTALSIGFWLSLAATASLIILSEPLDQKIRQWLPVPEFLSAAVAATACIHIVLLPLLAAVGGEIALPGLLANLPAASLTLLVTLTAAIILPISGLCMGFLGSEPPDWLFQALGRPLAFFIDLLIWLARQTARVQLGRLSVNCLNLAFWLAWLLLLVSWSARLCFHPGSPGRLADILQFLSKPALTAWLLIAVLQFLNTPLVQVWFFDVGQGDAILIIGRNGETLLIDGGRPGCGMKILLPAMDALGIRRIDLAVVTHGHADHAGGIIELIEAGRVNHLLVPAAEAASVVNGKGQSDLDLTSDLLTAADAARIGVSEITGSDTIVLGQQIRLDVLNETGMEQLNPADINAFSLLMLAELANCRVLLTADCTQEVEDQLMASGGWPAADVLKVAHHGSRFATSDGFIRLIKPETAIISVGPNLYGHPADATLNRLASAGCRIMRTDRQGALHLDIFADRWQTAAYCP